MKALITGVAGQVGSHLADMLLKRGYDVVGIDNFATGRKIHLPSHPNFNFIEGTIANAVLVDKIFHEHLPDVVAHAAASYKDPDDWVEDLNTNAIGGMNLVRASERHAVKRFVYFQTALIYGLKPITNPITLNHPKRVNNSSYAISKSVTEDYLSISRLDFVVFRLANVIGDRCVSGPLPIFYQRLVDGKQCFVTPARRDFVYVGDLVNAVVLALEGTGQGSYHFSSGRDYAIEDLFWAVVKELNLEILPEPERRAMSADEAPSILLDPSKTLEDFGVGALTPLSEIVRLAVAYYRKHGTEGEFTHLKATSK